VSSWLCTRPHWQLLSVALVLTTATTQAMTFVVTRTDDPANPVCQPGDCSLRGAVIAANSLPGADSIVLPAGQYVLEQPGENEDAALSGDIDITEDVVITGAGRDATRIESAGLDRVFDIAAGLSVSLQDLGIDNLVVPVPGQWNGGGVRSGAFGTGNAAMTQLDLRRFAVDSQKSMLSAVEVNGGSLTAHEILLTHSTELAYALKFTGQLLDVVDADLPSNAKAISASLQEGMARLSRVRLQDGGGEASCTALNISGSGEVLIDHTTVDSFFSFSFGTVCIGSFNGTTNTVIRDSTISRSSGGAGLYTVGGTTQVINSTFANNFASQVQVESGASVMFASSTISTSYGYAVYSQSGGTMTYANTLIVGSCSGPMISSSLSGNVESPGNTCQLSTLAGDKVNTTDSQLAINTLGDYGGGTNTLLPLASSVLIDMAGTYTPCPLTDQRGYLRQGPCDVGAVEANGIDDILFRDGLEY